MNSSVIEAQTPTAQISHRYITKDGRQLQLRLIQAADAERLEELFYRLSPESRWRDRKSVV